MIFAFAEDATISILSDGDAARREFEPIDVESGVVVFYAEDGTWLEPRFTEPNRHSLFGLIVDQGRFELVPRPDAKADEADAVQVALADAKHVNPNPHFDTVESIARHIARLPEQATIAAVPPNKRMQLTRRGDLVGRCPRWAFLH